MWASSSPLGEIVNQQDEQREQVRVGSQQAVRNLVVVLNSSFGFEYFNEDISHTNYTTSNGKMSSN